MTAVTAPIPRDDLIVCPHCDAAYTLSRPGHGERAVCHRCDTVLIMPRRKAGLQIIALSVAIVILITAAAIFPFLSISAAGARNSVSILDAALAFSDGPLVVLSLATAALIIFVPLTRVLLSLYVLVPIVMDRPPARHAAQAFRLAEALRPWSMAEIFAIGCAVALVKVSDLADVSFGPAFWMFAILVVLVVVQDNFLCRWSVWNALSKSKRS
ncbi:paraquat-inducible protein A [uncultured Roseobacter sp.]|uniref:paraquat-inducible protein A n=1 Tax=uncultured Roseobacter sp. TaxID=114847 RepID=UPI002611E429|nr:paraquat-inducible protein A [uncultured Roseobacter sp.]